MATRDFQKRAWIQYEKLQNWAASTDPVAKSFKVKTTSFEDPTIIPASTSNNTAAASTTQTQYVVIIGLIYPLTKPFQQRGLEVEIRIPEAYPHEPPEVYMKTKIRHPNIEINGRICTVLLDQSKKWEGGCLADVVKIIINLMDQPERGHVVDAEMGSLYDSNIDEYNKIIMKMVIEHGILTN